MGAVHKLHSEPLFQMRQTQTQQTQTECDSEADVFDFLKWSRAVAVFRMNALRDTVWYISSKVNHSCAPNIRIDDEGAVTALRPIQRGEELVVSYLKRDASLYKTQTLRRIELEGAKGFRCECA